MLRRRSELLSARPAASPDAAPTEARCARTALSRAEPGRTPRLHLAGLPPCPLSAPVPNYAAFHHYVLLLSAGPWARGGHREDRASGRPSSGAQATGGSSPPPLPLECAFRPPFPRESFQGHSIGGVTGCRVRCTDYPVKASTLFRVWRWAEMDWACGHPDRPLGGGPPPMRTTACPSGVACLFLRSYLTLHAAGGEQAANPQKYRIHPNALEVCFLTRSSYNAADLPADQWAS